MARSGTGPSESETPLDDGRQSMGSGVPPSVRRKAYTPQRRYVVLSGAAVALAGAAVMSYFLPSIFQPIPPVTTVDRNIRLDPELSALIERHVEAARRRPRDARARATLGLVYEANELWPEARACFLNATALDDDEPSWPYHAAIAWSQMGDVEGATEWMRRYAKRFPMFTPLQHRLGVALLDAGEFREAEAAFRSVIGQEPGIGAGYVGLGDVKLQTGDAEEAVRLLEKAVELDPGDKTARYILGRAYRSLGRLEDAERELTLGAGAGRRFIADAWSAKLSDFDLSIGSRQTRAVRLLEEGKTLEAVITLRDVLAAEPDNVDALINLGTAYLHMDRPDEALDTLLHARQLDEGRFEIYINLSACCRRLGRSSEALEYADRAVALAPELAQTNHARGVVSMQLGANDEALPFLRKAANLDARNPKIVQDLGNVCVRLGLYAEALTQYQTLAKLLPTRWEPHLGVAKVNLLMGRLDEAAAALDAGLQLAPDEPRLHAFARRLSEARER